jgi:hypothetical protein
MLFDNARTLSRNKCNYSERRVPALASMTSPPAVNSRLLCHHDDTNACASLDSSNSHLMPTLSAVNFNIVCATFGGFITLFGLVSYLLKEKYYLSEAREFPVRCCYCRSGANYFPVISLVGGVIFSPYAANLVRPLDYA